MMPESPQDNNRDLIKAADNQLDRLKIRKQFINMLHRHLDEIELSSELIIADPFIFPHDYKQWYFNFLKDIFEPLYSKVNRITFITDDYSDSLFRRLSTRASTKRCVTRIFSTNLYHDRFWLSVGNQKGIYIGNSLTGIGKKYCFIGVLPNADAAAVYKSLQKETIV